MFPKGQYGVATHIKEDEAKNANLSQSCLFQPSPSTHTHNCLSLLKLSESEFYFANEGQIPCDL